jgi:hypothetical protein
MNRQAGETACPTVVDVADRPNEAGIFSHLLRHYAESSRP